MDVQQIERKLLELEAKFERLFPTEHFSEFEKHAKLFYEEIRKNKPYKITSPKIMSRILEMYPRMPANRIDDFLLQNKIGDEKALLDFLDLEQKNRENKPLIEDDKKP